MGMKKTKNGRAVVLLSGGLDSTTALYWAKSKGYAPIALAVRYGQRHAREILAARAVARRAGVPLHEVELKLPWLGVSSLTNKAMKLPNVPLSRIGRGGIPSTYVPGRNTMFLALAASLADALGAAAIVIGANALDYSGYPDCRPEFIAAFERLAQVATADGVTGRVHYRIHAPLLHLTKAEIVRRGVELGVDYSLTHSCYDPSPKGLACGRCDSCVLRHKGFAEAGVLDPTRYASAG